MEMPIRIKQVLQLELATFALLFFFIAIIAVFKFLFEHDASVRNELQPLSIFYFIGLVYLLFAATMYIRNRRKTFVIDEKSMKMLNGEDVMWEVDWSNYGGFRTVWPRQNRGTIMPTTVELLDNTFKPVGKARLVFGATPADRLMVLPIINLLTRRTPPGGLLPRVIPPRSVKKVVGTLTCLAVLGACLFAYSTVMMLQSWHSSMDSRGRDEIPPAHGNALLIEMIGAMMFGLCAGGAAAYPRRAAQMAANGNIEQFATTHAKIEPVNLETGHHYRYADTDALLDNLKAAHRHTLLLLILCAGIVGYSGYAILGLLRDTRFPWMVTLWGPMFAFMGLGPAIVLVLCIRRLVSVNKLRNSLADEFYIGHTELEVSRQGTTTTYPLGARVRTGLFLNLFGATVLEFQKGSDRYWMDNRFLIEGESAPQ